MSEIYVFSSKDENNDYASFGLVGALIPTEAKFNEVANGDSTIEITHPIDDFGRYKALVNGNIIVAPVPVRTTPEIQNGKVVTTVWTYKVRPEDQLTSSKQRTLYRKAKGSTRMRVLKAGEEMTVVSRPEEDDARWKVKTKYGTGYMLQSGIELVEEKKIEDNSGSIEEVQSPWTVTPQLFRIYEVKKSLDEVSVSARHISYDLLYNITTYSSDDEAKIQNALDGVLGNCVNEHEFHAYTNVENVNSGLHYNGKNPIDAFFDEEEGICKKFDVSMIRDNFDLYFLHDPGINRGIRIIYGKNLTGVDFTYSIDEVATRIFPVGEKKDGTPFYLSDNPEERYIDSEKINDYPVIHVHKLDCENCKIGDKDSDGSKITEKIARARMKKQAEELLKNGCDEPKIEMDVEFVNLGDTEEYSQFKNLENAFLYDYIMVEVPKLDINVTARITEIEWDIIAERMESVKIGSVGKTLANTGITSWQIPSGINGSKIGAGTIGSRELGDEVIDTRHMQAGSVSTDILQVNCVTAKQIAANSITADKIDANAVTSEKIDAKAITAEKIDSKAITSEKIEAGAITADKIGANAITAEKIEAGVITGEKINAESVGAALADITKAQIAEAEIDGAKIKNATIESAKIALGAITTALIQNGAIGEAQIADASITSGKIVSLNADVIDAGTLSVERLLIKGKDGIFYALNATVDGITAEELSKEEYENQLSGQVIIAKSITADQIAAHTITANELAANTITAGQINVADLFANQATINEINNRILNTETIKALNGKLDLSANTSIKSVVSNVQNYIASRGENLITNGTALLGDNTNFSKFTFDGSDAYYSGGCFKKSTSTRATIMTDEFIPVDVNTDYSLSYMIKLNNSSAENYDGLVMYDIDKKVIGSSNVMFVKNTLTRFAEELKPGDTTIHLESLASFEISNVNHRKGLIVWNYKNSYGYEYPAENYSRNVYSNLWSDASGIDKDNNIITLTKPWSGPTIQAGTYVSQKNEGATYSYGNTSFTAPEGEWVQKKTKFSGFVDYKTSTNSDRKFRKGTAYVKLLFLLNYSKTSNFEAKITNVTLTQNSGVGDVNALDKRVTAAESSITQMPDKIAAAVKNVTATGVNNGGSVIIDTEGVEISGGKIDIRANGDNGGWLALDNEGISSGYFRSPYVASVYADSSEIKINSGATEAQILSGSYYKSLASAFSAISNKSLYKDISISLETDDISEAVLTGIGGKGSITINGNGHTLTGSITADSIDSVYVNIENLTIVSSEASAYALEVSMDDYIRCTNCTFNGNSTTTGDVSAILVKTGGQINLQTCALYNANTLINAESPIGHVYFKNLKGGNCGRFLSCDSGSIIAGDGTRPDGSVEIGCAIVHPDSLSGITIDYGDATPSVPPITKGVYLSTNTDTYSGYNWNYGSHDDVVQGFTNKKRLIGCMWFDNTKIRSEATGKTPKQALIRLSMYDGVGRGAPVTVNLCGSTVQYSNHASVVPSVTTSYGAIGTTNPGETMELDIPITAVTDLINGTINCLVLYSDDTAVYKTNGWSKNYARFYGESTGDDSTKPQITIQYQ